MQSRDEIAAAWRANLEALIAWFEALPDDRFTAGPDGRWTAGEHLDHLLRSTKPVNMALRLPKVALRMRFGTADKASQSNDELVQTYENALEAGGRASGAYIPKPIPAERKAELLADLRKEGERLVEVLGKWDEKDLDRHVLPHPLLGNLTVREMLYFTVHHTSHHHETLARDYAG